VSERYKFEAPGCRVIFEAGRLAVTIRSSSVVAIGITPLESFTGLRPKVSTVAKRGPLHLLQRMT
jgi:hypothetical protein